MPLIPYDAFCEEDEYHLEMAKMHKLTPKLDVIHRLRDEMSLLQTDSEYATDVKGEQRDWLILHLSAQIFALALELTDDLAAVCTSYKDTLQANDTKVVERIAGFGVGEGHKFYREATSNAQFAGDALGVSASDTYAQEQARKSFEQIQKAREMWWRWYTGYKHGQYATPVALGRIDPAGNTIKKWGLYLVSKKPKRRAGQVHTGDRFIDTVAYVDHFIQLARTCVSLWSQTFNTQFPKVFKTP